MWMARNFKDKQLGSTKPFNDKGHSPKIKDYPSDSKTVGAYASKKVLLAHVYYIEGKIYFYKKTFVEA